MDFLRFGEIIINKKHIKKVIKVEMFGKIRRHCVKLIDMDNKEYLLDCIDHETKCQLFEEFSNILAPKDNYAIMPMCLDKD